MIVNGIEAEKELEVMVGTDRIVRVNLDGGCVLRVRLGKNAVLLVRGAVDLIREQNGGDEG